MIGKTQMIMSSDSVAQAIEEYINRHLLHEHMVKVSDWSCYKSSMLAADTTVVFEAATQRWPPEHATRLEPQWPPVQVVQTDAPDDGPNRGVGFGNPRVYQKHAAPPSETEYHPVLEVCVDCHQSTCVCPAR